jgi:hypothetical protein
MDGQCKMPVTPIDQLIYCNLRFHQFQPISTSSLPRCHNSSNAYTEWLWLSMAILHVSIHMFVQVSRAWLAQIEASSDSDSHGRCPMAMSHGMACDAPRSSPALSVLGGLQDPVPRDARTRPSQSLNETMVAWLATTVSRGWRKLSTQLCKKQL